MAKITKYDPADWKTANVIQVDVDAKDNWEAVDFLDDWASDNGFARVNENFLRIIMRADGSRVFRGTCYRLTDEESRSVDFQVKAAADRAIKVSGAARVSQSAG